MASTAILLGSNPHTNNYYAKLVSDQKYALIPRLELENGQTLNDCPIAYQTWGTLNKKGDNALVVCHALTGSSDVSDWWNPLIGPGKALDPRYFFIFCGNVLGSPYGSASPVTINPATGRYYGTDFPSTTIRDDIHAHKLVLDALGVRQIAAVIGGSMGGMATLEWPLCTPRGYARNIIPIATAADHSAWGISWAETQRQCIYADPKFKDGHYEPVPESQPSAGLAAARMIAMLTYRSCTSFDSRFGRSPQKHPKSSASHQLDLAKPLINHREHVATKAKKHNIAFSAQGYLHYQGEKFIKRFDANCFLHLSNKMDSHDVTRNRTTKLGPSALREVLGNIPPGALVVSVESDALFVPEQQERLAACLPEASLETLESSDSHDGFLLEFEQLDRLIQAKLKGASPHLYSSVVPSNLVPAPKAIQNTTATKKSLVGETDGWW
ncbi:AB hydrolase-1 domain-containing protein [Fusarium sp. LHS14.1]|nr:AB hydrolase-1 domain-containing protein [Fusarium sp. LHS14.1]